MKQKIYDYIMEVVNGEDMMEYTEFELEDLINDISNVIDRKASTLWVTEISDGKYMLHIKEKEIEKEIQIAAWESKEEFINDVYELFLMPDMK